MTESQLLPKNKTIAFSTISLILLFSSCRSLETIDSEWLTVPVDSHGKIEDFTKNITSHLYENGLLAGVGNDEKYLYILFSPDIRHYMRPPSRASLELWLDAGGSRAKKFGFLFSVSHSPESPEGIAPPNPDGSGMNKPPTASESLLQVIDKVNKKQTFIAADGSQGPQIRFSSDWGDFVYAWRIPLAAEIKENSYALSAVPGQTIGVGLLWECEPLFAVKKSADRPDATPGGGGPGGGGGRMDNYPPDAMGGGPEPGADMTDPPTRRKIWLKIILAQK